MKCGNWSPLPHGVLDGPVQTGRTSRADPDDLFRTSRIACRKQVGTETPLGTLGCLFYWLHFLELLALCSGEVARISISYFLCYRGRSSFFTAFIISLKGKCHLQVAVISTISIFEFRNWERGSNQGT